MSWMHRKAIAVAAVGIGVATILGATLGIAVARHSNTVGGVCANGSPGCNIHYVGTIKPQPVSPATFTQCLPAGDWVGIYIWDGPNQKWLHYFNTNPGNPGNYPSYLNSPATGGISTIPGFSGVVLIMRPGAPNQTVTFLDANNEACN
jgi:hypothetical protein